MHGQNLRVRTELQKTPPLLADQAKQTPVSPDLRYWNTDGLHRIALAENLLAPLEDQADVADGGGEGGRRHLPDQPLHVASHL